jgi:hypothetical protein
MGANLWVALRDRQMAKDVSPTLELVRQGVPKEFGALLINAIAVRTSGTKILRPPIPESSPYIFSFQRADLKMCILDFYRVGKISVSIFRLILLINVRISTMLG